MDAFVLTIHVCAIRGLGAPPQEPLDLSAMKDAFLICFDRRDVGALKNNRNGRFREEN
jgi:hypothetical protein